VWWDIYCFARKLIDNSAVERSLKIGYHLAKLEAKVKRHFSGFGV